MAWFSVSTTNHLSPRADGDPLGPVEGGGPGRPAVTAVAHLAGAGDVPQPALGQLHPPHAVAFAERQPHRRTVDEQGPRAEDWIPQGALPVDRQFLLLRSRDRVDDARPQIDPANAMVADVGDVQVLLIVQRDAVRLLELSLNRRSAVAAKTGLARARQRRNDARLGIHAANEVVLHFDEEHVAIAVEADFVRLVQARLRRRAAVPRVALASVAGHRDELATGQIDAQHPMIPDFGHVQGSVRPDLDAERVADVDLAGEALTAVVGRFSGSSHGLD